jgi:hypothetical protein
LPLLEDRAPIRRWWLHAEAEETERRLDLQHERKQQDVLHKHERQHVARDVAEQDRGAGQADAARGLDIGEFRLRQRARASLLLLKHPDNLLFRGPQGAHRPSP